MQTVSFRTISFVSCTRNSMGKMVCGLSCLTIKKNNFDVKILKIDRSIFEKIVHEKFNNCIISGFSSLNNQTTRRKNTIPLMLLPLLIDKSLFPFMVISNRFMNLQIPHFLHRRRKLRRTKHSINIQQILQVVTFISTSPNMLM